MSREDDRTLHLGNFLLPYISVIVAPSILSNIHTLK